MLNLKIMTKFEYLYKRAYTVLFDQYRILFKFLQPFLIKAGDEKSVSRFEINGFGSISLRFVRKSNTVSFGCIHIATSCDVYHADSDFCLTFNDLREPSAANFRRLVYLRNYFSCVYASLKVDYNHLCQDLAKFETLSIGDGFPF